MTSWILNLKKILGRKEGRKTEGRTTDRLSPGGTCFALPRNKIILNWPNYGNKYHNSRVLERVTSVSKTGLVFNAFTLVDFEY